MSEDVLLASARAGMRADLKKQRQDEFEVSDRAPHGGITYLPKRAPLRVSRAVQQGLIKAWGSVHIDDTEAREQRGLAEGEGRSWDHRPPNECMRELQEKAAKSARDAATVQIADLVTQRTLSAMNDAGPNAAHSDEAKSSSEDESEFFPPDARNTYKETKADIETGPCYLRIAPDPEDFTELDVFIVMDGVCECLRNDERFRIAFQVVLFPADDDAKFCIAAAHLKPRVHNFVDLSTLEIQDNICVIKYTIEDTKRQYNLDFKNKDATQAFSELFQLMISDWTVGAGKGNKATEEVHKERVSQAEAVNEPVLHEQPTLIPSQGTSPSSVRTKEKVPAGAVPSVSAEGDMDSLVASMKLISLSEEEQKSEDSTWDPEQEGADPTVVVHVRGIFNWLATKVPLKKNQPKLTRKILYQFLSSESGEVFKHIMYRYAMDHHMGNKLHTSMSIDWNKTPKRKCYSMAEIIDLRSHASRPEQLDNLRFLPKRKQTESERIMGLYPKNLTTTPEALLPISN